MSLPVVAEDKAKLCLAFIKQHLTAHGGASALGRRRPLVIGLNGVQGIGKSTLVASLAADLEHDGISTLVLSLDDFYLTNADQVRLARDNPDNALLQHRGEPGTHDVPLLKATLSALTSPSPSPQRIDVPIPRYDKSLFQGRGDRVPREQWPIVTDPCTTVQVVILEGWAVGFQPLSPEQVRARWEAPESRTLRQHKLEHLLLINGNLAQYVAVLKDLFDAFVHLDSEDTAYVYAWRQEQEDSLRRAKHDETAGMTPEQVVRFVDGYYPAYELYTEGLRRGIFAHRQQCQLRIVLDRERRVKQVITI